MKHTIREHIFFTVAILVATILGAVEYVRQLLFEKQLTSLSPLLAIIIVLAAIGIGTVAWLFILKKKKNVSLIFALSIMLVFISWFGDIARMNGSIVSIMLGLIAIACGILFYKNSVLMKKHTKKTKKGWSITGTEEQKRDVKRRFIINNLLLIAVFARVSAVIAVLISPFVALLMFAFLAIYDAWAVWVSGHMNDLANGFLREGVFPGLVLVKKDNNIALLGGGDVFAIVLLTLTFLQFGLLSIVVLLGMLACLIGLFYTADEKKMYPAIPYLITGAVVSLVGWYVGHIVLIIFKERSFDVVFSLLTMLKGIMLGG